MITFRAFGEINFLVRSIFLSSPSPRPKCDAPQKPPSTLEITMLILNYTLCVPVLIAVGTFSLYHLWSAAGNTTTIESWEKDKVASLKRRGKIREVRRLTSSLLTFRIARGG